MVYKDSLSFHCFYNYISVVQVRYSIAQSKALPEKSFNILDSGKEVQSLTSGKIGSY